MTWDELLEGLEALGQAPEELDFMDNYGPIVGAAHSALEGRHVRCIFGSARLRGGIEFETYVFASPADAEEFHDLLSTTPGWHWTGNMVFHTDPRQVAHLGEVISATLKWATSAPD